MNCQSLLSKAVAVVVAILVFNQLACSNARFGATGGDNIDVDQTDSGFAPGELTNGIDIIEINNGGEVITYDQDRNNIYVAAANNCVRGILRYAGDPDANAKIQQLLSLVDSSQVGVGTLATPGVQSIYLNLRYDSGQTRTFNLRQDQASTNQQTLSKGQEIINFFDQIHDQITYNGVTSCNNGKK